MEKMIVRTRITFEVEYPLDLKFYETEDKDNALNMERQIVRDDPALIVELFNGKGSYETSVESIEE